MGRAWRYKLARGKQLRTAIENGTTMETMAVVIDMLEDSCKEVIDWAGRHDDEDMLNDFEDLLCTLDGEAEVIRTEPGIVMTEWEFVGGVTELVEDRLSEFYDLADRHRVWVTF